MHAVFSQLFPIISTGTHGDKAGLEKLEGAFHILDAFLEKQNWVAGKNITIADYSIIAFSVKH